MKIYILHFIMFFIPLVSNAETCMKTKYVIHGTSMEPFIENGQFVYVTPINCYDKTIQKGDVVLFRST